MEHHFHAAILLGFEGLVEIGVERRGFEPMAIAVSRPRIAGFRQ